MAGIMTVRRLALLVAVAVTAFGCSTAKQVIGVPNTGDPSIAIKSSETNWLLIRNPRFGDVPSEPEYVWVEEDKTPMTMSTVGFGKGSIIAPPEIVVRYGSPPGGGKISPRQGMPTQTTAGAPAAATTTAAAPRGTVPAAAPAPTNGKALEGPKRGFVVYVDTTRIVIDLTAADGIRAGTSRAPAASAFARCCSCWRRAWPATPAREACAWPAWSRCSTPRRSSTTTSSTRRRSGAGGHRRTRSGGMTPPSWSAIISIRS